ncbi:hypothetical protein TNCV_3658371 [Trichonephila clavipes]|nr:hypothetical protein TNCV_3658371 [Trichonephila clavipes]
MDLAILELGQVTRTAPELVPPKSILGVSTHNYIILKASNLYAAKVDPSPEDVAIAYRLSRDYQINNNN